MKRFAVFLWCLAAAVATAQTPQYIPANGATSTGAGAANVTTFPGVIKVDGKAIGTPVNVKHYGVKCDGVTADEANLTTALNSEQSLILPPGKTCAVSSYMLLNNQGHVVPPGGDTVVDLNGSTIKFTGTGDTTKTWVANTQFNLYDTFIQAGYIQVVTTAGTSFNGAQPTYSTTYGTPTTDGTMVVTNFGIQPYKWQPNTTWYVGQKISSGGHMYRVEVEGPSGSSLPSLTATPGNTTTEGNSTAWAPTTAFLLNDKIIDTNGNLQIVVTPGTSGAGPTWAKKVGGTTVDGSVLWQVLSAALVWRNIGPPPTTVGCGNAYNGLLRIASPHWVFKNGTLEAANAAATCVVNLSWEATGGFGSNVKLELNFYQDAVSPDMLTNTDAIFATNQNQLDVQNSKFYGALGRAIVCGDWSQTAGGNYCDRPVIRSNNNFARTKSNFAPVTTNQTVTLNTIYTTNSSTGGSSKAGWVVICTVGGTTDNSTPTWPTVLGNTVTWGTATFKLIQIPSNYDPQIYGFFTGAGTISDNNFEWGPAVAVESKITDDVMTFSGNLMTDGTPDYWSRFDNTTFNADGNEFYFITAGFGTGIFGTPANNCNIKGNAIFNAFMGIYVNPSGSTNACTIEGNTIKGIPAGGVGIQSLGGKVKASTNVVIMASSTEKAIELGGGANAVGPNSIIGKYFCDTQNNFLIADPANVDASCTTAANTISDVTRGLLDPPNLGQFNAFCTGSIGTTNGTFYILAPATNGTVCNSTTASEMPMPLTACTARNMYIKLGSSATTSVTVTMYKNGSTQALTATLGAGVSSASDLTHTVSFVQGDTWSIRAAPGQATESVANIKVSFQCY